jgi:hypothetical protein
VSRAGAPRPAEVDPFDLPEWLGEGEVTWAAEGGVRAGNRVPGRLTGTGGDGGPVGLACDLLAVDEAFPAPVVDAAARTASHQAWRHGEVHLGELEGRLTLLVPGSGFDADRVLDAVARLARSVGADPDRYAVLLRIGRHRPSAG